MTAPTSVAADAPNTRHLDGVWANVAGEHYFPQLVELVICPAHLWVRKAATATRVEGKAAKTMRRAQAYLLR